MNTLTVYIKYLPAEVQILFASVYNQPFEAKRLLKIGNKKNDLRLILNTQPSKIPCICISYVPTPEAIHTIRFRATRKCDMNR